MRDRVVSSAVCWGDDAAPISIIGSNNWAGVSVACSVLWEGAGAPWIAARVVGPKSDSPPPGPHVSPQVSASSPHDNFDLVPESHCVNLSASAMDGHAGILGHFTNADGVLQYKCRLFFEFSIENAETMENVPGK